MDYTDLRERMISEQILARGVRDQLVLQAMSKVRREAFVATNLQMRAYEDRPLPIGHQQTISQPFIVAYMIESLKLQGGERVLEIGAGCGYAAAVLAEIASEVFAIERIGQLAEKAATNLMDAGYSNVHVLHSDGTRGWDEFAPFDAILVSAGATVIPVTLKSQLNIEGSMIVPVGANAQSQQLIRITRGLKGQFSQEVLTNVSFVPLISDH